ncbi:RagB/SusD family nutrient uptake outer membrane protein [Sphingobacterium multivorum]|uniref:RagB/SusD family nutrient uptake outer membrane protein n=1 Tax=Sphingobacterium multivorum TaxID=28454 RepID=UPI002FDAAF4E
MRMFQTILKRIVRKNRLVLYFTVLLSGTSFSCKKIDNISSERLATEDTNWKTYEDARANLFSVYALMRSATVSDNSHWVMGDLRQGDFTITNRSDLKAIVNGQLNASYPVINRITNWRRFYAVINAAALFIERSPEILELDVRYTKENNDVDIAQARILRAFAYFYMCRIWGDVPLLTSSHDGEFPTTARVAQDKVLGFATNELLAAAKVVPFRYGGTDPIFPGSYFGQGWASWNGMTFTRITAYDLLAHIAAWQGNYVEAAAYAQFVIDNMSQLNGDGSFGVSYLDMNALTENDNYYSPFSVKRATLLVGFAFESGNGMATSNGHIEELTLAAPFIPKSRPEMFVSKDSILNIFKDSTDLRFSIDKTTNQYRTNYFYNFESERPIFNKIKVIAPESTSGDLTMYCSSMVFSRMEEITLLRAEALAVLGDTAGAFSALNKACDKRGIAFTTLNTPDILDAIFQERRRELMAEGWRWFDIIRYNRIKQSNAKFITKDGKDLTFREFERAGGIYWPISQDVIDANSLITQNPYWN